MFKKFRFTATIVSRLKSCSSVHCNLSPICCNLLFIIYIFTSTNTMPCMDCKNISDNCCQKNPPELDFFSPFLTELLFSLPRDTSHCSFVAHLGQIGALPILPIWNSRRPHVNTVSPSSWRQIAPLLSQLQVSALNVSSLNCGRSN